MKTEFFLFILIFVATLNAQARGGVDGGGGRSIVCRDSNGAIKSTEVLDLYEGRILYGLRYQESAKDWPEQIEDILKASGLADPANRLGYEISNFVNIVKSRMRLLPDDTQLNEVNDSFEPVAPIGCKSEQAVNYINENLILFSGLIWKSFSNTQKAAMVLHEAIYRVMREEDPPETNSKRSRHFNAFLFSGGKPEYPFDYRNSKNLVFCDGKNSLGSVSSFYIEKGTSKPAIHLINLNGRRLFSKSSVVEYYENTDIRSDWSLFEQLLAPTGRSQVGGFTTSQFESGDYISITISTENNFGPTPVLLYGRSGLDRSESLTYMQCKYIGTK